MATLPRAESDPVAESDLATHAALTKGAHGIADSAQLATKAELPPTPHTFVQEAEPKPASGFGPFVWMKVDGSGNLLDILGGVA